MNTKLSAAGFAVQTARGAAEAQPDFWGPVAGGGLTALEVEQAEDELTSAEVGSVGEYRESAAVGSAWEGRAWPASIGGLLYAVLGEVQTTGGPAPYTHTIIPAASLPWVTVFSKKDADRKIASDCKLDELKIEWEGNAPLKVSTTWMGLGVAWSGVEFVPGLDEKALDYFKGIHLAATLDLDGSGKDAGAKVLGGSLDVKRNCEADIYSGDLLAGDIFEGALEIDAELKLRVPDLSAVRLLVTGALAGSAPSEAVPYGDFSLAFTMGAASLTLAANKVAWKTSEPDADPKGGPGEITLTGRCYGTPSLTAVAVNSKQSY